MFDIADSGLLQQFENELHELERSEEELAEQISQTWQPFADIVRELATKLPYDQLNADIGNGVLRRLADGRNWKHGEYLSHLRPVYRDGTITVALDNCCDIFIFEAKWHLIKKVQLSNPVVQAYIKCGRVVKNSCDEITITGNRRKLLADEVHLYNKNLTYYKDLFTGLKNKYVELVNTKKTHLDIKMAENQLLSGIKF
jgi:hypothetical protein